MRNIKKIISEEVRKQMLKEYANNDLGSRLNMIVVELEQLVSDVDADVANRLSLGDKTVSKRDSMVYTLKEYTKNLRKLSNIINRQRG